MAENTFTQIGKAGQLGAMVGSSGSAYSWTGAEVLLFTNQTVITADTILSDLVEPSWSGYARQPVAWESVYNVGGGAAELAAQSVFWLSAPGTSVTVYGYGVVSADGELIYAVVADAPIFVIGATGITVVPVIRQS